MENKKSNLLPFYIIAFVLLGISIVLFIVAGIIYSGNKNNENKETSNTETSSQLLSETPTTKEPETTTEEETFYYKEPTTEEEFVTPNVTIIPGEINFSIQVNIGTNCVTIFAKDENGNFTVPYKAMACSSGLATEEYPEPTPVGNFNLKTAHIWCLMVDWTYSQYSYFIYSDIMFHSTPVALDLHINKGEFPSTVYSVYTDAHAIYTKSRVKVSEFNKLGQDASLGCIRLTVEDAKWIFENCPTGTPTSIIDSDESADPIKKPEVIKINEDAIPEDCGEFIHVKFPLADDPTSGLYVIKSLWVSWDPTDPDPRNPWHNYHPEITVPEDGILRIPGGSTPSDFYLYCDVSAIDTCRNDVTDTIKVSDNTIFKKRGTYENITLSVKDLLGREASVTVTIEIY